MSLKSIYKILRNISRSQFNIIFIIAAGSVSAILVNLIFAKVLSPKDFGQFSLFLAVISFLTSFGLLGMDQSLVRAIITKGRHASLPLKLIRTFSLWILFSSLLAAFIMCRMYNLSGLNLISALYVICFSITAMVFFSSLLRSHFRFLRAQFIIQGWKLFLFIFAILFYFKIVPLGFNAALLALSISCFMPLLFFIKSGLKIDVKDQTNLNIKKILSEGLMFTGMVATVGFLNVADRFTIPKLLSYEILANYFVFWTVICGPFILLQTTIAFVLLPKARQYHMDGNILQKIREVKKYVLPAVAFLIFLCIFMYFFSSWIIGKMYAGKYAMSASVKILLIFLGASRLYYAFASALVGAVVPFKGLLVSNFVAILSVTVFISTIAILGEGSGLFGIVFSLCCAWLVRNIGWTVIFARSVKYAG